MKALNIASLGGSELFDALLHATKTNRKIRHAPPPNEVKPLSAPPQLRPSLWRTNATVLFVHKYYCTTCEKRHTLPNSHLMVHKTHPLLGEHYIKITPAELLYTYPDVPRQVKTFYTEGTFCDRCFDLFEVIIHAMEGGVIQQNTWEQLPLPLPMPLAENPSVV